MSDGGFLPGVNRFWGRPDKSSYSDLDLADCEFQNCHFLQSVTAGQWNIVRNVTAANVINFNSSADTVCFENVVIQNLKRAGSNPLFMWGCVFERVQLKGVISSTKINRWIDPGSKDSDVQKLWDQAVVDFYKNVDWALDISAAKFSGSVTFEAIPGDKIRIDPSHQAIVTREKLSSGEWKRIDFDDTALDIGLSWFLQDSLFDSVVVAATIANRKLGRREVEVIERLRDAGIAEPH